MSMNLINMRIVEKYGLTGKKNIYLTPAENTKFLSLSTTEESTLKSSNSHFVYNFCRKVFLPQGYPKTVSEDYFEYQFYDTIQAFASRISGTISTKCILKSVGVGNAEATPLSAAIIWIFKDGIGMFCSILFAWQKGSEFDANCKRWRLFADVVNDLAMFIEILLAHFNGGRVTNLCLLCLTTSMKGLVGVAGGATRAAVTQHQAVAENAADVAAKDGSQETAVNLVASIVAILLLTLLEDSRLETMFFVLFTVLHLLANWLAVISLVFRTLNIERMIIISKSYVRFNSVPSTLAVNRSESVFFFSKHSNTDVDHCGFQITLGTSFQNIITHLSTTELDQIVKIHKQKSYLIVPDLNNRTINVLLSTDTSDVILTCYFHALIFGLAYHIQNNLKLDYLTKRTAQNTSLLERLRNKLNDVEIEGFLNLLAAVDGFIDEEGSLFLYEAEKKGWRTNVHSITLDDWRFQQFHYT